MWNKVTIDVRSENFMRWAKEGKLKVESYGGYEKGVCKMMVVQMVEDTKLVPKGRYAISHSCGITSFIPLE